jgi:ubiquinone/menaquinone biosynthesis C-methylase UbiE
VKKISVQVPGQQEQVNAYFQSQSSFWKNIYTSDDVYAQIHRDRHAAALAWIDSLTLAPGSPVLEIGCGAGFMAIALAQRRLHVQAIDSAEAMIEQACRNVAESGVTDLLSLDIGNVYSLAFADGSFDLVVALGVIPWLGQPELAIQEMARVTKPGGHIIFSADNRIRLNALLDPLLNPLLAPLKRSVKAALDRVGLRRLSSKDIGATFHSRRFIDRAVMHASLAKSKSMTLGFGPFTFFRRTIIPEPFGTRLHLRLQSLVDRGVFGLRSTGAHYLIQARKPICSPVLDSRTAGDPDSDTITALSAGNGGFIDDGH